MSCPVLLGLLAKPHSFEEIVLEDKLVIERRADMCEDQQESQDPPQMMDSGKSPPFVVRKAGSEHNCEEISFISDQPAQTKDEKSHAIKSNVDKLAEFIEKGIAGGRPRGTLGGETYDKTGNQYDEQ